MIGHDHVRIADVAKGLHQYIHVHHAFVGPHLLKVALATKDIAEVDEVDLLALAEVTQNLWDLLRRILDRFGHAAKAEIQPMIVTRTDLYELPEPIESTENPVDALETGWKPRIAGVTGHANPGLGGDRNDTFQEKSDSLPILFRREWLVESRCLSVGLAKIEGRIARIAATRWGRFRALILHLTQVLLNRGDPCFSRSAYHLLHDVDLSLTGTEVPEHIRGDGTPCLIE